MKCPACGVDGSSVMRTQDRGSIVRRRRLCRCGISWVTRETVERGSLRTEDPALLHPESALLHRDPPDPGCTNSTPRCISSSGGVGGGLSSDLGPDPVQSSDSSQRSALEDPDPIRIPRSNPAEALSKIARTRSNRGAKAAPAYSAPFSEFWAHTGSCHGNKGAAWKAWCGWADLPTVDALRVAWTRYMASQGPQNGAVQHVSTWLNQRGWETDWRPFQPRQSTIGGAVQMPPRRPYA